jgi:hypothetical protein
MKVAVHHPCTYSVFDCVGVQFFEFMAWKVLVSFKEEVFGMFNIRVSKTYPWGTPERNIVGDKK